MLTADLVDARRKDGELLLRPLDGDSRREARLLGAAYLEAARVCVGKRREELEEAWEALGTDASPKLFKLAAGLKKLAADACAFEAEASVDPVEIRRVLFTHASEARRTRGEDEPFDRAKILGEAARILGQEPEDVERALFADLRSEHVLRAAPVVDADGLVEAWELGQAQAVLLVAVRVTCEIGGSSPGLVRAFFSKLKFHQLLFSAERRDDGFRVVIDGPYSMFDAVTKYGLRLALVLPALRALEHWSLVADVRWGKEREPLVFRMTSEGDGESALADPALHMSDEVRELADAINAGDGGWRAKPATAILDVPGQGVCIPDLELTRKGARQPVYVEVLGYWSRDAVFRRVELAERGLGERVIFAVSSRLRVSAEVLGPELESALYVYKGKMSPRAVIEHAARISSAAGVRSAAGSRASRARGKGR
jgi:predicted nuclease of restriction endonuclease-like RecB superfamily